MTKSDRLFDRAWKKASPEERAAYLRSRGLAPKTLPVQRRKPRNPKEWQNTRAPIRECPRCGGWQRKVWGNGSSVRTHWRHLAANTFCRKG